MRIARFIVAGLFVAAAALPAQGQPAPTASSPTASSPTASAPTASAPTASAPTASAPTASAPNTLSKAETAAGWKLLFDGKTTAGWRGFHSETFPTSGWAVENGTIKTAASQGPGGGDIITVGQYDNFELQLEWKISPGGNSGVKYLISEDLIKTGHSGLGFEMQIIDDAVNPDAKAGLEGNRTAGALYDLITPKNKVLRPVGEWNQIRVIVKGPHVEQWLNGGKVVEFEIGSPELKALIAGSKFKTNPGFGEVRKGHILLQAHGADVWFRNIKVRQL